MNRSLQRHLSKMLSLAVLICGVIASVAAFYFAYSEAQEFQDDTLLQIAALSVGTPLEIQQLDAVSKSVMDPESRIQIIHLPVDPRPMWLSENITPGFHTVSINAGQNNLRVFVRDTKNGSRLVVAQSTDSRDEIAFNTALQILIPLLLLLPILIGLIAIIVRGEFTSLRKLSENIDHQATEPLTLLPENDLPAEIIPFIQAINRLLERVDKMITEQRRFIADAAHELRTPLTALSLQVQNLAQAKSSEEMRKRLVPLQAGIERARNLTVQLLDLARLQASDLKCVDVDVQSLGRELIAEFHPLADAKQIDLGIEDAGLKFMSSDPRALGLIIRNALENAIKYTPPKGKVTLQLRREGEEALIEVIDDGPGIPNAKLENAFDPFHRLSGTEYGCGLGLAIAREASIRCGGRVDLRNRKGHNGLVFSYKQLLEH
jgi:two-component system, OmpR family, sensor kinase